MSRKGLLWAALLGAAGCSFQGRGASPDGGDDQAPDARADAAPGTPDGTPGTPDATPVDTDGDGVRDSLDNCDTVANADQANEDGDDRGDACDLCPHLAGTETGGSDADTDGDGIGDQCDPRVGTDRLVVFLGFNSTAELAAFAPRAGTNPWTISGGQLHQPSGAAGAQELVWTGESVTDVLVTSQLHVDGVLAGAGVRSAAVLGGYWDGSPVDVYACGLRGAMPDAATNLAAWHYVDPPMVHAQVVTPFTGTMSAGAHAVISLVATDVPGNGSGLACAADLTTTSLPVPDYIPSGYPGFRTISTTASYDYLFVVAVGG